MMRLGRLLADDGGAIMVLYAVLLAVLIGMAALVLDLGALRVDRRQSQTAADMAAVAGSYALETNGSLDTVGACNAAWQYVLSNTPGIPSTTTGPCSTFFSVTSCDPATAVTASKTVGAYVVSITTPVPDTSPLMGSQTVDATIDGGACDRVGVAIQRTRGFVFGPVLGYSQGSAGATAVGRSFPGGKSEDVPLVILDPTGCSVLSASGQGNILVQNAGATPGRIAIDSTGAACNSNSYVLDAGSSNNTSIKAVDGVDANGNVKPAGILMYALYPGSGGNAAQAYNPAQVTAGRLAPRPTGHQLVTRRPIDQAFNCKSPIINCTVPPYIDNNIRTPIGCPTIATSSCATTAPTGYDTYTGVCNPASNVTVPAPPHGVGWWVNCPGGFTPNGAAVTFTSGNVVFQGTVTVKSSGSLIINSASATDDFVAIRSGGLVKDAQATIKLNRSTVYLHNGFTNLAAGTGKCTVPPCLSWTAPTGGAFKSLALWSESATTHAMGGAADLSLAGLFFIPNALFSYTGQPVQTQTQAQFVVFRMEAKGQGSLVMMPNPDLQIAIPIGGAKLVR